MSVRIKLGIALGVIVLGTAIVLWYTNSPYRWPVEYRDAFVRNCAFSGGMTREAMATRKPDAQLVLAYCECVLGQLQHHLSFDEMKRDEALVMAGGFRPTPHMEAAMLACGVSRESLQKLQNK